MDFRHSNYLQKTFNEVTKTRGEWIWIWRKVDGWNGFQDNSYIFENTGAVRDGNSNSVCKVTVSQVAERKAKLVQMEDITGEFQRVAVSDILTPPNSNEIREILDGLRESGLLAVCIQAPLRMHRNHRAFHPSGAGIQAGAIRMGAGHSDHWTTDHDFLYSCYIFFRGLHVDGARWRRQIDGWTHGQNQILGNPN